MKKISLALILIVLATILCGCVEIGNRQFGFDSVQSFFYATIYLGNDKYVEGKVENWRDFEDGDEVQVMIGGITYLTHYENVILQTKAPNK